MIEGGVGVDGVDGGLRKGEQRGVRRALGARERERLLSPTRGAADFTISLCPIHWDLAQEAARGPSTKGDQRRSTEMRPWDLALEEYRIEH